MLEKEKIHLSVVHKHHFLKSVLSSAAIAIGIITISLIGGMFGYRHFENMSWIDAYVNAAMILSGMGPIGELKTEGGKIFAGTYALYSGIIFLVIIAIVMSPVIHRILHQFHMENLKTKDQ